MFSLSSMKSSSAVKHILTHS
eukprot:IDg5247t1